MKIVLMLAAFYVSSVFGNRLMAQDLCSHNPKYCKLLSDTGGVKMILVTLPPGASLSNHTHPMYMGYILKGGLYKWSYDKGKTESFLMKEGGEFHSGAEPAHHSWNAGKTTIQFILVEKS
jgi:quercetin dioxygenase-like cupin family protein